MEAITWVTKFLPICSVLEFTRALRVVYLRIPRCGIGEFFFTIYAIHPSSTLFDQNNTYEYTVLRTLSYYIISPRMYSLLTLDTEAMCARCALALAHNQLESNESI